MGFWQRAGEAMRNAVKRRRDEPLRYYRWVNMDAPSGILVTQETALQISVVWGCVMAITNALASCKWNVYAITGEKREWLTEDPLDYLLNTRPNPDMTAVALKESLLIAATTWGNGYAEIVRNGRGQPVEMWPMLPDRTVPRRRRDTNKLYFEYHQDDGSMVELDAEDVYHLHGPGITGLMGDNLVARAAKTIALAAAQERFASTYFGNNTIIGGVLTSPHKMAKEAHDRVRSDWEDMHKGPFKANKPAILEGGVKWEPFATDLDKAQAIESRKFSVEDICRWFGVPPHKVQHLERSTFNNIEHLGIEFVRDALTPWSLRMEQEADFKLIPQKGPKKQTKLDMGWLTHGDFKSRMEGYQIGRNMGVYSANEIRAFEGKNGIGPLGDARIVAVNMQTLDRCVNPPAPQLPPGGGGSSGGDGADEDAADVEPNQEGAGDGSIDTGTGDKDGGGQGATSIARESFTMLFDSALGRYAKRQQRRGENLLLGGASQSKVQMHLAANRSKWRAELLEEVSKPLDLALKTLGSGWTEPARARAEYQVFIAADALDNGCESAIAAEQLLSLITANQELTS